MNAPNSRERTRARQRDLEKSFGLPEGGHGVASGETVSLTPDQLKARKRRNVWIALSVLAFIVLVFAITVTQMQANILDRPL